MTVEQVFERSEYQNNASQSVTKNEQNKKKNKEKSGNSDEKNKDREKAKRKYSACDSNDYLIKDCQHQKGQNISTAQVKQDEEIENEFSGILMGLTLVGLDPSNFHHKDHSSDKSMQSLVQPSLSSDDSSVDSENSSGYDSDRYPGLVQHVPLSDDSSTELDTTNDYDSNDHTPEKILPMLSSDDSSVGSNYSSEYSMPDLEISQSSSNNSSVGSYYSSDNTMSALMKRKLSSEKVALERTSGIVNMRTVLI